MASKVYQQYRAIPREDYDQTLKIEGVKIGCYSPKRMKQLYPEKNYHIVGETKRKNKKDQTAALTVWRSRLKVSALEDNSKLLYRKAGYVCVGEDTYVVLLKLRFLFLIWFLGLGAGIGVVGTLLWLSLHKEPILLQPDHPLPSEDPYAETIPAEEDEPAGEAPQDGGGSVAMIYTLSVDVSLSSGKASIHFRNPSISNHDIALVLYVISGEEAYPIGQSGLVKAGNGLSTMDLDSTAAQLMPGVYTGKYKVLYYDPITGEKALVEPEITDLVVTVTE